MRNPILIGKATVSRKCDVCKCLIEECLLIPIKQEDFSTKYFCSPCFIKSEYYELKINLHSGGEAIIKYDVINGKSLAAMVPAQGFSRMDNFMSDLVKKLFEIERLITMQKHVNLK